MRFESPTAYVIPKQHSAMQRKGVKINSLIFIIIDLTTSDLYKPASLLLKLSAIRSRTASVPPSPGSGLPFDPSLPASESSPRDVEQRDVFGFLEK